MGQKPGKSRRKSTPAWTKILKALADENRLKIIGALLKQKATVQDLAADLDIKVYNISKHLRILEGTGLVEKKKDGIHRIYGITPNLRSRISRDNQVLNLGCCKFIFNGSEK